MRNIICSIKKEKKGWWKRLLKSEEKPAPYIKVDWNKWCDEDDEESDIGKYISEEVKPIVFACFSFSYLVVVLKS